MTPESLARRMHELAREWYGPDGVADWVDFDALGDGSMLRSKYLFVSARLLAEYTLAPKAPAVTPEQAEDAR